MIKIASLALLNLVFLLSGSLLSRDATGVSVNAYVQTIATLSGLIVDENGAVIPQANVTLLNRNKSLERHTVTDDGGAFVFLLLPPDGYLIRAQCDGFTPVEVQNLTLNAGEHRALRIQMKVGGVGATVNINERAGVIESAAVGAALERRFIENLPLNGRGLQPLLTLLPGVVLTKATVDEQGQFSVNGQRANANYFSIDGVSANTSVTANSGLGQAGAGALPGLSATGSTNSIVSVDAVQEFKVQTSTYAPEFGRAPGGQIGVVTRAGTNEFSGALYDYFRNEALNANDWFANRSGARRAPLRQNNFGGVVGGPVWLPGLTAPLDDGRERTFFFFSYEGLRLRQPLFGSTAVPTVKARQDAPARLKPILEAYPLPNGEELGNGMALFSAGYADPTNLDAFSLRVDHTASARQTWFIRYSDAASSLKQRTASLSQQSITEFAQRSLTVGATQTLAKRISNELRVNGARSAGHGFNRVDGLGGAVAPADAAILPPFASAKDSLALFYVLGLEPLALGKSVSNAQRQFNLVDHLSVTAANHQLKFGADYRRLSPVNGPRAFEQVVNFNGVTGAEGFPAPTGTLLSGRASSVQIAARDPVTLVYHNLSAYGQDSWRATSRLNLTFGLRWELNPPPRGTNGKDLYTVTNLAEPAALALALRDTPLWQTTYTNFAPRVGFAYRLASARSRELTLRGGFGLFYDLGLGTSANRAASFPYYRSRNFFTREGLAYPLNPDLIAPPPFSLEPPYSSFDVFAPQLKLPRTWQWSAALEQALGAEQTLTATYVGAVGRQLLRREALRELNADFFAPLFVTRNAATADYHALQLQFRRRLATGWQALLAYTWSHSIDLASNDSAPLTPAERLDPRLDRGPSDFDVRHMLAGAASYQLPAPGLGRWGKLIFGQWALDAIWRAQTATPLNVVYTRDLGFGFYSFRPDLVPGMPVFLDDPSAPGGRRLNQAGVFVRPPAARQGTLGRNALRGFGFWQADLAVRRQFVLHEQTQLQLRAEFFNLFNHPNFAEPRAALADPLFGLASTMLNRGLGSAGVNGGLNPVYQVGGARSIQLSLRLAF